jgi:hypothetical protein
VLRKRFFRLVVHLLGLWLILEAICRWGAEFFWFEEVGYLQVLLLRLKTQGLLWALAFSITAFYLVGNLLLAQRLSGGVGERGRGGEGESGRITSYQLPIFLPLVLGLNLLVGLLVLHYGQVTLPFWHPDWNLPNSPLISTLFRPEIILPLARQIGAQKELVGLLLGLLIAISIYPRFWLLAIALLMSVIFATVVSGQWARVLQYLHPTTFNSTEPVFNRDISFYVFALPIWELLEFWLVGLFLYGLVAVTLTYLLSEDSLSQGSFRGFSQPQLRHLQGLGSCFMLAVALGYWVRRYELLYSTRGVAYGASYTDVTVQLPAYTALSLLGVAIAVCLFWSMVFGLPKIANRSFLRYGLGLYVLIAVGAGTLLPLTIQRVVVQPNELAREQPYIRRSIALTQQAFNLDRIDAKTFEPQGQLTLADIQANDLTIRNIRLWDQRPLLQTNRQLQQIRLYYRFPDADIDRYTLQQDVVGSKPSAAEKSPKTKQTSADVANTERRQTLIAARELDYTAIPQQAQTWVNQHLVYTHGYGFTLSPVNTVAPGGLPEYFVKDIGVSEGGNGSPLTTSNAAIKASIPIGQPRIYYGEIANNYVITATKVKELDYPSGNNNVYNTYDGSGGISINSGWRRLLFAKYLNDWQMLLTRNFLPQTKLLFRRNINQRIRAIAPFLRYDSNPYLVVADAKEGLGEQGKQGRLGEKENKEQNYLYWIVDAYTTSDRYPYSDPGNERINYIRNSVKVVIDAFHGSVNFYVADTSDPIIASWQRIFPGLFQPLNAMPTTLQNHIRYPVDFFNIQSERLMTYHMSDPQVFYNREDQWQIPNEVYGNQPKVVEPYYLITSLPGVPFEEFILLLPYTPKQRTNLVAWLAARSDGDNYGRLLLYELPKQELVYGTEQIEARINQDPVISQQISLWNRQGSRVLQGNLLVIPIEQSLLYVEPIYLEADQNSLPTLIRVVVAYENRIVMAQTLEQGLQAIFSSSDTTAPPIVRPVEESTQ